MANDTFKNDPNYLLKVCEGLEELRRGNKNDIRESQVKQVDGLNRVISDINKYLLTVATALIPIIFSLVTINEIRQKLNQKDGNLIAAAIVLLFISLVFGFIHMITESSFFRKGIRSEEKKLKMWSSTSFWPGVPSPSKIKEYIEEYDSIKKNVDKILSEMPMESTNNFLVAQGVSWLLGLLFIVFVIFGKLP